MIIVVYGHYIQFWQIVRNDSIKNVYGIKQTFITAHIGLLIAYDDCNPHPFGCDVWGEYFPITALYSNEIPCEMINDFETVTIPLRCHHYVSPIVIFKHIRVS